MRPEISHVTFWSKMENVNWENADQRAAKNILIQISQRDCKVYIVC